MNPPAHKRASNGVANSPQVAMMYSSTRAVETKNIPEKKVMMNQIKLSLFISLIAIYAPLLNYLFFGFVF
jgi:hypothetical protein